MTISNSVKTYFEGKLKSKSEYLLYIKLAEYLDKKGEEALGYSAIDAHENYNLDNPFDEIKPSVDEWKQFLTQPFVSKILTDEALRSRQATLRKQILNLDADGQLDKGQLQALGVLKELLDYAENVESTVKYIQYTSPIRFDATDEEVDELVNKYCVDTTGQDEELPLSQPTNKKTNIELELEDVKVIF